MRAQIRKERKRLNLHSLSGFADAGTLPIPSVLGDTPDLAMLVLPICKESLAHDKKDLEADMPSLRHPTLLVCSAENHAIEPFLLCDVNS